MSATLLRYLIVSTALFLAGWFVNGWRLNGEIAELNARHTQAALEFQMRARVQEHTWNRKVEEATHEAAQREQALRADADRARRAADGLRDQLADIRGRLPELTEQAVRQYASAASVVFGECVEEYRALAETADRLDSDRRTLMEAWPE